MQRAWTHDETVLFQVCFVFKGRVQLLTWRSALWNLGECKDFSLQRASHDHARKRFLGAQWRQDPARACSPGRAVPAAGSRRGSGIPWGPRPPRDVPPVRPLCVAGGLSSLRTVILPATLNLPGWLVFLQSLPSSQWLPKSPLGLLQSPVPEGRLPLGQGFLLILFAAYSQCPEKCLAQSWCPISIGRMNISIIKTLVTPLQRGMQGWVARLCAHAPSAHPTSAFSPLRQCWGEQSKLRLQNDLTRSLLYPPFYCS